MRQTSGIFLSMLLGFGVAVAGFGVVTLALAHGGDASKIHSCVNRQGALRVVGASEACDARKGENPLDWNVAGPAGSPGTSGWEIVESTHSIAAEAQYTKSVTCPGTKKVLGGGVKATNANPIVQGTYPSGAQTWTAIVQVSNADSSQTLTVFAICAAIAS